MSWERYSENRDRIRSGAGGWNIDGLAMLHGYDIQKELVPNVSWMQAVGLAVTGRLFAANDARLIEAMNVATGYPDPRLWCNRVVSLAGSMRCSATGALSAGIASGEARLFGMQANYKAAKTVEKARHILEEEGEDALKTYIQALLRKHRVVYGFGRPLARIEERIAPIEALAESLNIPQGPHLSAALAIEKVLNRWKMIMNYSAYSMARLLDMNLSPMDAYRMATLGFYTGLMPCYIEAFENEPGTFLPIACEDILYEGVPEREVPE